LSTLSQRVERDTTIVLGLCAVGGSAIGGWRMGAGVLGGGLLLAISYRALKRAVEAIGPPAPGLEGRPTVSPWRLALGLAARYALLLGAGYVIIARLHLHPLGVLVGVSAVVVAAMMEAVRSWRQPTGFSP
jgi:ATP synthase I chain